ncbi:Csu type fimbrial protein [Acinetobacter colistiniresistens]|uniref:Spore coat protein U/FanG domain-containing protein n=1 Tax=Acinetobacter colistiniresistens TaxID=280145 RepID=S3UMJ2_9GAMM|nr:spore coat protein U domain-containing protein [Acinetobacter colistiniresistens]EPG40842.1 hypothetical protein F907_00673 [Acinetobacter colistiniresistens]
MIPYFYKTLLGSSLFLSLMSLGSWAHADCNVSSSGNVTIAQIPSIALTESGIQSSQFSAGLQCTGFSLGVGNKTYLKYRVDQMPVNYVNSQTGDTLTANYLDTDNKPITRGREVDMSQTSLINFFNGPDGSIPFYVRIPAGQTVSPGTYLAETPFKVKWYYSVPALAIIGFGSFYESPGFKRPGIFSSLNWGSGRDSSINLKIEVKSDCRISTSDVNFGTAAFAAAFEPVKTSMGVRCSAKTPYYVSLNNGLYPRSGNQRAMKSESSNHYLTYDIYKNSTTERWGSNSERWSSASATTNAGNYDGKTQQGYAFTAKILESNPDNLPAGTYRDTVTIQVEF